MPEPALACQPETRYVPLVERRDPERERKDPERADPITRLIASRVREIRDQQSLSGAALSTAVRDLGLKGWVDSTVGKLETRRRESVTVRELLALAVALDVPPVWLLVDPESDAPVPIVEGRDVDPWAALMWLTGWQPLEGAGGDAWTRAEGTLDLLVRLALSLKQYRLLRKASELSPMVRQTADGELIFNGVVTGVDGNGLTISSASDQDDDDPAERRRKLEKTYGWTLRLIAGLLKQFSERNLPAPQMPPDMRGLAAELDIDLPGQEELTP